MTAAVILRSFSRNLHRTLSAAEIGATDASWHPAAAAARPVGRREETLDGNQGLARLGSWLATTLALGVAFPVSTCAR